MKFDIVVGNPPYQENDNGQRENGTTNASASPLYHHFFDLAKSISDDKINLIFPARWLTGAGKGLSIFHSEMLEDTHVKSISIFMNSSQVFPNTEIKGGVLYLIYDKNYSGKADVTVIDNDGECNRYKSYLNSANSGVFIPYEQLINIYIKVRSKSDNLKDNIQTVTSSLKPFGLRTDFFRNPQKYNLPELLDTPQLDTDIEIIGLDKMKRVNKYIPKDYPVPKGENLISKWKVFGPYAYGTGKYGEAAPNLMIGKPNQICTETFLVFGPFKSEIEALYFKKYFSTKFFRSLIGILKTTQHSTTTYNFIPLQDFTSESDIDWSKSMSEIDQQLYKKYGLNQQEINFIETKVKAMD